MTAPRELLDQLDALHAAGTPGPWENPHPFTKLIDAPGSTDNLAIVQADNAADAALIVAAVNALPQLTAAVRAALDKHSTTDQKWCDHDGFTWPCPTVRDINDALSPAQPQSGNPA